MDQSLCILGRQPSLGLAELESLYGSDSVHLLSEKVAGLSIDASRVNFALLGGSTKLAKVISVLPSDSWNLIEKELIKIARSTTTSAGLEAHDSGKFNIGISALGLNVTPAKLTALGLTLKKILRNDVRPVRIVPNQTPELSTAQVYHNHLTDERGAEIILVKNSNGVTIARTIAVQDIDSYTVRDRNRPKRDSRVGMLPPKLAQIIINLTGTHPSNSRILDPFCGTGVLLQEALLMDYSALGTDLEPRMVSYSQVNLDWAHEQLNTSDSFELAVGDATTHQWDRPIDAVACETYLGRAFTSAPSREILEQTASDVNLIVKKFLRNIHSQLKPGTRLCLAVPAWQISPGKFRHLPLIDSLEDLGYKQLTFKHVDSKDLIYYRDDQTVARKLLVLISN